MPTFREDTKIGGMVPMMKTDDINDQAITKDKIRDGNVTAEKLADGAVSTDKLPDGAIKTPKIADGNITTSKLSEASVVTSKIADQNVTKEKIADQSVDNSKLSPEAVTYDKVKDKAIITEKLNDRAVTTEKVEEKAITNAKIGDSAVDSRVISEASVEKKHLANDSVATEKLQDSAITSDKIHIHAVTEEKIDDSAISNSKLADNSVGTSKIKDGNVTNEKVANNTLTIDKFDPELRKSIQAATGLPENLVEVIQDVDVEVKSLHSKDEDLQSQIADKQQQITANDKDIESLQNRSTQMEQSINNIAVTGGASVANTVTYSNTASGLVSINAQGAIDELAAKKFDKESILQESGDAEDKVMSQKAVSLSLTDLSKKAATKFYVSNADGKNDIMFSDNSITFQPKVSMRRLNGERDKEDGTETDITELFTRLNSPFVTLDSSTGKVTVVFDGVDNSNMSIYYDGEYHVCLINIYAVPANAELVLHCGRNAQGFYFMGGAASMWELTYNEWKLKNAETDIAKKAATKFYVSEDRKGVCTAKFDDETGTVVFSPTVSMRRLNGDHDERTDIHEKLVAAGCTYDEKTKLCTLILGGNVDNISLTIYRLNGTYGVTHISIYEVPQDAEIVLHIAKNPDSFYFMGGAAPIWTARYNYLKLQKTETKAAKNIGNQIITQFYKHPETWSLGQKKITLLHFSDIHGDEKNFKRIVQYVEENKSMLTDVICTGDIVNYQFSDGIDWWKNNIGDNKILMAIGNHDPLVTQGTFDWFGKNAAECYERYFSPYIANWGVNYMQGLCYYYKDYSDVSIRLIVLDGMRWNNIKEDAAQEEWFKQKLNDAKEKNLHVIVASHFPPDTSVGNKNNNINFDCWYSDQSWETEQYGLLSPKVADSVDSFQKNGGNFICYIGGHTHGDLFRPLKRYPNQLMVIVANASCYEHVNHAGCWYSRSESDNSQDLFNLLNIDTENKILSIVRVGCSFDRYARHIGTISFDYENHKVLSQY